MIGYKKSISEKQFTNLQKKKKNQAPQSVKQIQNNVR